MHRSFQRWADRESLATLPIQATQESPEERTLNQSTLIQGVVRRRETVNQLPSPSDPAALSLQTQTLQVPIQNVQTGFDDMSIPDLSLSADEVFSASEQFPGQRPEYPPQYRQGYGEPLTSPVFITKPPVTQSTGEVYPLFQRQQALKQQDLKQQALKQETPQASVFRDAPEDLLPPLAQPNLPIGDIAEQLTEAVLGQLNNTQVLSQFLNTRELEADNRQLASQLKHLLKENRQLQENLKLYEESLCSFKQIVGNIYLKVD